MLCPQHPPDLVSSLGALCKVLKMAAKWVCLPVQLGLSWVWGSSQKSQSSGGFCHWLGQGMLTLTPTCTDLFHFGL